MELFARVGPLVGQANKDVPVEEGQLPQAVLKGFKIENRLLEYLGVGFERGRCAGFGGCADYLQFADREATGELYLVDFSVAFDLDFERFAQGVDD